MENSQKIKLLKLMELLLQETDEDHPMTSSELCRHLEEMHISCDRRTLHKDMKVLNEWGYEVLNVMVKHEKAYYIADRMFSAPELKILIDAVQAANFITEKKTSDLINKLAQLGGNPRSQLLKDNIVCFNTHKHRNEMVLYTVGFLEDAIRNGQCVSFRYFDLRADGDKELRKKGAPYHVEPVALVYSEDNYYLIAYSVKYGKTANYRVDRMSHAEILDEPISEEAQMLRSGITDYTESVFRMFGGKTAAVTLAFPTDLIGPVFDKFGEDIQIRSSSQDRYSAAVEVQISPTFWGWVFQFGGRMTILAPEDLREEYRKQVLQLLETE